MDPSCLVTTVQGGGGGVMVLGMFSWLTLGLFLPTFLKNDFLKNTFLLQIKAANANKMKSNLNQLKLKSSIAFKQRYWRCC